VLPINSENQEIQGWLSQPFLCGAHRGCFGSELASLLTLQTFVYKLIEKLQNMFWNIYYEKKTVIG
jgi:hypothetical protein